MTKRRESFPVVGSFNEDSVLKIDAQRTINMYEVVDPEAKKPQYMVPWPGKLKQGEFINGGIMRAAFTFRDKVYYVVGDTIYSMDNTLLIIVIANAFFSTITRHVGIAANEKEIIFVDGIKSYLWDTSTSTGIDNTPNLPVGFAPLDVTFMDGYFILISNSVNERNKFRISALNNGASWPVLDFALVNSRPTDLAAVTVLKRRVFLFGENKSEIWLDAGLSDFPFRRDNNLLLEHGVRAISSVTEGFDRLFYLSGDTDGVGSIMMVQGTLPKAISTREVDEAIQAFTTPEDATGFVFKINGQIFYQINFTADDRTFIYNVDTNKWHEAAVLNGTRDIANAHAFFDCKHFVGSYADANLYQISEAFLKNDGAKIKRTRICRVFNSPTYERIRIDRMWIDMLQGVGLKNTKSVSQYFPDEVPPEAPDVDPVVFLSISEDGGATYQPFGTATIGKSGARLTRTIWRSLGVRRDAICKFEIYNAVPVYILGGSFDFEVLSQ